MENKKQKIEPSQKELLRLRSDIKAVIIRVQEARAVKKEDVYIKTLVCPFCRFQRKSQGKYKVYDTTNHYLLMCVCCGHYTKIKKGENK